MIDIVAENERNLKNVRQIGTPGEEDKIYIENEVYKRIHAEDYAERRIFIFMGHTEKENNRYMTFVEAAIPVPDIEFVQNIPQWSSHAWSDIFQEIKRSYDNTIIVGWAMDIKGFSPDLTPELEAVHREQFGGAHQVLFLMDSVEGEEHFYLNKGKSMQKKEGFFVYYSPKPRQTHETEVTVEVPEEAVLRNGRSRLLMDSIQQEKQRGGHRAASYAMTAAVLLLIGLVGFGVYQDRIKLSSLEKAVNTMGNHLEPVTESDTETLNLIPIRELPSGEIQRVDDTEGKQENSEGKSTGNEPDDNEKQDAAQTSVDLPGSGEPSSEIPDDDEAEDVNAAVSDYYVVRKGDTLSAISKKFYGSTAYIEKLADLNHLENCDDIRVGQKLLLP